jgi:hypothetical protein
MHNLTVAHDDTAIRQLERLFRICPTSKIGMPRAQFPERVEDLANDPRRKSERRLVT